MGGICSCFHVPDDQDQDGSISSSCFCPSCFLHKFKNNTLNLLPPRQNSNVSLPNQNSSPPPLQLISNNIPSSTTSSTHGGAEDDTFPSSAQHEVDVTRRSQVHPEPVEQVDVVVNINLNTKPIEEEDDEDEEVLVSPNEGVIQEENSNLTKALSTGVEEFLHKFPSPNDVEECPTCLEEYNDENPKIVMKCYHHYHLSCIYEWMERNENCPVCGKLMEFEE